MLRVISGIYRHRLLKEPNTSITRPTQDRIREAIFNNLRFKVNKNAFLDLFAGSGAIGIEAISNGFKDVFMIEQSKEISKIIIENLKSLNIENFNIFVENALNFVEKTKLTFDVIYLDPPYNETNLLDQILQIIYNKKLLQKDGYLIIETRNANALNNLDLFIINKIKNYGKTQIIYLIGS